MSFHLFAVLALAVTFGGMTFFSAVVAPLVFRKLPPPIAGGFIRGLFPWYYLTMGATTLVALLLLLPGARGIQGWAALLTAAVLFGFVFARQVLMPMINRARDADLAGEIGAARRFKRLHRLSVVVNASQWLAALAALVLVVR
jgi:hypothetical protein